MKCSSHGCAAPAKRVGLCMKHYVRDYKDKRVAVECDCGAPAVRLGVCARCAWADGATHVEAELIAHLRGGPATIESIAMGAGVVEKSARRALGRLRRTGRVHAETGLDMFLRGRGAPLVVYRLVEKMPATVTA